MIHYSQIVAISFIVAYGMIEPVQSTGQLQLHLVDVNFTQWRRPRENCSSPLSCAKKYFIYSRVCFTVYDAKFLSGKCILGNISMQLNPTPKNQKSLPHVDRIINFTMNDRWMKDFSLIFDFHTSKKPMKKFTESTRVSRYNGLHNGISPSTAWYTIMREESGVTFSYSFRFVCAKHYYGTDCKTLCKPSNDSLGHYRCSSKGKRICLPGWSGDYCDVYKCEKDCHMICDKSKTNCKCQDGWTGSQCNKCKTSDSCVHGDCVVNETGIKPCECHDGWGGHFCEIDLHYCGHHKNICKHGSCYNMRNPVLKHLSFMCKCKPGYWGITCELKQCNASHPTPCRNRGKCMLEKKTKVWSCICPAGYFGSFCEINSTQCAAKHCPVSGTVCQTDINDTRIRCVCPPGQRCGNKTEYSDYCDAKPCLNGGTCKSMKNGFRCSCPEPLSGNRCQFNKSHCNLPCKHGICRHTATRPFCYCTNGYTGNLCECPPCIHGECYAVERNGVVLEHRCSCKAGYYGSACNRTLLTNVITPDIIPTNFPQLIQTNHPSLTIIVIVGAVAFFVMLSLSIFLCCRRIYRHQRRASQANNYIKNNRPTTIQNDLHSPMTLRPDSPTCATVHPQSASLSELKKPLEDKLDHPPAKIHNTADQSVNLLSEHTLPLAPNLGANLNTGPNSGLVWPLNSSIPPGKKTAVFLSSPEPRRRQGGINWFSSVNNGHATQV